MFAAPVNMSPGMWSLTCTSRSASADISSGQLFTVGGSLSGEKQTKPSEAGREIVSKAM